MPLPHFELTRPQYRFLAEAALGPLPDPDDGEGAQQSWSARELDPDDPDLVLSELVFAGLVTRGRNGFVLTPLGAAVHHRAAQEEAENRLAAVVLLTDEIAREHPRLARAVRLLAQGIVSPEEASARLKGDE